MSLTIEQRQEKSEQHMIVFAQFAAQEFFGDRNAACELLCAAAARAYRSKEIEAHGKDRPIEWVGEAFSKYMRELVIEGCPP